MSVLALFFQLPVPPGGGSSILTDGCLIASPRRSELKEIPDLLMFESVDLKIRETFLNPKGE